MEIGSVKDLFSPIQYREGGDFKDRCKAIEKHLKKDVLLAQVKRAIKENLISADCEPTAVYEYVWGLLTETELGVALRNKIYELDEEAKKRPRLPAKKIKPQLPAVREPLDVMETARCQWDEQTLYELKYLLSKISYPHVRSRGQMKRLPKLEDENVEFPVRFIYTSDDIFESMVAIESQNFSTKTNVVGWNSCKLILKTPTLEHLAEKYRELRPDVRQMGVDESIYGSEWFGAERERTGTSLANTGYIPHLKNYAKTGVPNSLRPTLWGRILKSQPTIKDIHHYNDLKNQLMSTELITDFLVRFDVQETADNEEFFVFSDNLLEIMLIFFRDPSIRPLCSLLPSNLNLDLSAFESKGLHVTQSGVIPFYQDMYFMFRAMYARYFCRLGILSSKKDSIYYLARTFEDLLIAAHPDVFHHAVQIGAPPLRTVFPWIFTAFSGVLPVFEVLQLWDRVIAYDSLELIPALAAAIYVFRAQHVVLCERPEEVEELFKETIHIQAIPLLQHFLFVRSREL
ncbi:hypothetical protein AAMO2058_000137300 [Amorphochlora amoebiformis]